MAPGRWKNEMPDNVPNLWICLAGQMYSFGNAILPWSPETSTRLRFGNERAAFHKHG